MPINNNPAPAPAAPFVHSQVAEFQGLLEDLTKSNQQLDVVEKGLNDFLDTKKMAFPRFFFLSNDELLEILSEAKDPLNVQPFVKKCFEAVKELIFEPNGATYRIYDPCLIRMDS